jgi:subtilisin family serine protease
MARRALPAALPFVVLVLLGAVPAGAATDPLRGHQWNLDLIGSDAAHATSTGAGVVVAVVDSGIAAGHPDLAGRVAPGVDLVDNDATPQDGNGHGTHVSGIIAADTGNGVGVASVAPGATILPIRVLDASGSGSTDDVAKGIDAARERGADVINLSLGSEVPLAGATGGDPTDAAIHRALAAGIVVVAAAGNNSMPVCEQPAAADGLLCVGSVDRRRQRSFFSSFGSGLGLVAPGGSALPGADEDVLSTYPPAGYETLAGTSQAAPHVAGAAALLVALGVRGRAAVDRLLATADDLGAPGPDAEYGHGLLDARAAVAGLHATGGNGAGAGGAPAPALVRVLGHPTRRSVRRHGLRVRLRAPVSGRARLRLVAGGRTLVRVHRRLAAGRVRTVRVRPGAAGRRRLAHARHRVRARLKVRLPGETRTRVRRVVLR